MKKVISIFLAAICLLLAGCQGSGDKQTAVTKESFMSIEDSLGRKVTLEKKPERIVVLSASFLDLLYKVDGKAVGRASTKTETVLEAAKDLPEVGFVYNVNLEKLASLQPDLVIAVEGMHEKLLPLLESSHIPVIVLKYKTMEDTFKTIQLFGRLSGTEAKAMEIVKEIQDKTAAVIGKIPANQKPKAAILHATSKSVTIEQDTTIAGSIAKKIGITNVATANGAVIEGSDTVPYSLEKLVESDPDIVFVVTMGDIKEIKKRMKSDVENNPAWSALRAVQQQKVYFLPSDLFLVNPGIKINDSVEYMTKLIYPEVYGHVKE